MGDTVRNILPWPRLGVGGGFAGGPGQPGGRGPRRPGMHVVALVSQKADSGKTTLAAHLAVQAELSGAGPVAIVDTDPNGKLADWWNARREEFPAFAHTFLSRLSEDLDQLKDLGIKLCVVDTPPAIEHTVEPAVQLADLVVVPVRPSPHDLRAADATVELVGRLSARFAFLINAAEPGARITAEAALALSQHGTLAPVTVHDREDFTAAMESGRTVMETNPKGESATEVLQLWDYLSECLRIALPAG